MNETISQETNLALMKQVEQAVRPIPAGKKRKLQMREELLAHLTAIYQEELPRQPSETAALSAAFERFGSPAEISAELAGGVSWNQRLDYQGERIAQFFGRWMGGGPDGSLLRHVVGSLSLILAVGAVALAAFLGLQRLLQTTYDPILLPLTVKLISHSALSIFCYLLAIRIVYLACFPPAGSPRWFSVAAVLALWLGVFTSLSFLALYLITSDLAQCLARTPEFLLSNFFFMTPTILLVVWCVRTAAN